MKYKTLILVLGVFLFLSLGFVSAVDFYKYETEETATGSYTFSFPANGGIPRVNMTIDGGVSGNSHYQTTFGNSISYPTGVWTGSGSSSLTYTVTTDNPSLSVPDDFTIYSKTDGESLNFNSTSYYHSFWQNDNINSNNSISPVIDNGFDYTPYTSINVPPMFGPSTIIYDGPQTTQACYDNCMRECYSKYSTSYYGPTVSVDPDQLLTCTRECRVVTDGGSTITCSGSSGYLSNTNTLECAGLLTSQTSKRTFACAPGETDYQFCCNGNCYDPDASTLTEGVGQCNDGLDNNCNHLGDCYEPGCAGDSACPVIFPCAIDQTCIGTVYTPSYYNVDTTPNFYGGLAYGIKPSDITFSKGMLVNMNYNPASFSSIPNMNKFQDSAFENSRYNIIILSQINKTIGSAGGTIELGDISFTIQSGDLQSPTNFTLSYVNISSVQNNVISGEAVNIDSIVLSIKAWIAGDQTINIDSIVSSIKSWIASS
jgi:hypothetical protein